MCKRAIPKILQHVSVNNYRIPIYLGLKYNFHTVEMSDHFLGKIIAFIDTISDKH